MNDKTANDTTAITVMGAARAKGGHEGDVRQALHAFVEPARSEDGCLHYELYEDVQYTAASTPWKCGPAKRTWMPGIAGR